MTKCGQISQNRKPSVPSLGGTDNRLLSGKVQFISWLTQYPNYKKNQNCNDSHVLTVQRYGPFVKVAKNASLVPRFTREIGH